MGRGSRRIPQASQALDALLGECTTSHDLAALGSEHDARLAYERDGDLKLLVTRLAHMPSAMLADHQQEVCQGLSYVSKHLARHRRREVGETIALDQQTEALLKATPDLLACALRWPSGNSGAMVRGSGQALLEFWLQTELATQRRRRWLRSVDDQIATTLGLADDRHPMVVLPRGGGLAHLRSEKYLSTLCAKQVTPHWYESICDVSCSRCRNAYLNDHPVRRFTHDQQPQRLDLMLDGNYAHWMALHNRLTDERPRDGRQLMAITRQCGSQHCLTTPTPCCACRPGHQQTSLTASG